MYDQLGIQLVVDDNTNSLWIQMIAKMSVVDQKNAKFKEITEFRTKALTVGVKIIAINGFTNT